MITFKKTLFKKKFVFNQTFLLAIIIFLNLQACKPTSEDPAQNIKNTVEHNFGFTRVLGPEVIKDISEHQPWIRKSVVEQKYNDFLPEMELFSNENWDKVAFWTAITKSKQGSLPAQIISKWMQWRSGATGKAIVQKSLSSQTLSYKAIKYELLEYLSKLRLNIGKHTIAFGQHEYNGVKTVVLIFIKDSIHFNDFQLKVLPEEQLTLNGQFLQNKKIREIYFVQELEDQKIKRRSILAPTDNKFEIKFNAPKDEGKYYFLIESVRREDFTKEQKSTEIIPFYVGENPKNSPPTEIVIPEENASNLNEQFISELNDIREEKSLTRLLFNPILSRGAEQNNQLVASGNNWYQLIDTQRALARKGIISRYLTFQYGYSEYLSDFIWQLTQNPLFKEQIYSPSEFRIGFSFTKNQTNDTTLYSALYAEEVGDLDIETEKDVLFEALNYYRNDLEFSTFDDAEEFQDIADFYSKKVCDGELRGDDFEVIRQTMLPVARYFGYKAVFVFREASFYINKHDMSGLAKAIPPTRNVAAMSVCQGNVEEFPGGEYVLLIGGEK